MRHTVTFFNLGILLASLLGLNLNTSTVVDQYHEKEMLAESKYVEYNATASLGEEDYAKKLEDLKITLHPGTDYVPESKSSPSSLKHCKSLVYRTLKSLPAKSVNNLKNLTLYFTDEGRRGLGGSSTVILRCQNVTDEELVSVLVHEMGHVTDTGAMQGTSAAGRSAFMDGSNNVYSDDPSIDFYGLDFKDEDTMKKTADEMDFVSGYAMSDAFEDFAESYAYYVLHGNEFRSIAETNVILRKKYDFLKDEVFNGKEYSNGVEKVDSSVRHYDVTVLPYDVNKFFVI
jgi:hypothetical protein